SAAARAGERAARGGDRGRERASAAAASRGDAQLRRGVRAAPRSRTEESVARPRRRRGSQRLYGCEKPRASACERTLRAGDAVQFRVSSFPRPRGSRPPFRRAMRTWSPHILARSPHIKNLSPPMLRPQTVQRPVNPHRILHLETQKLEFGCKKCDAGRTHVRLTRKSFDVRRRREIVVSIPQTPALVRRR